MSKEERKVKLIINDKEVDLDNNDGGSGYCSDCACFLEHESEIILGREYRGTCFIYHTYLQERDIHGCIDFFSEKGNEEVYCCNCDYFLDYEESRRTEEGRYVGGYCAKIDDEILTGFQHKCGDHM